MVKYINFFILFCSFTTSSYTQTTLKGGFFNGVDGIERWFFTQKGSLSPLQSSQGKRYINYYLNEDLDNDGLFDLGKPKYLRNNLTCTAKTNNTIQLSLITVPTEKYEGSSVLYYFPNKNVANIYFNNKSYLLNDNSFCYRQSELAPANHPVRIMETLPLLFEIPTTKRINDAFFQIKFVTRTVAFHKFEDDAKGEKFYYPIYPVSSLNEHDAVYNDNLYWLNNPIENNGIGPTWPEDYIKSESIVYSPRIIWRDAELVNEGIVVQYNFFWCGDGVLSRSKTFENGTFSEECDPNDPKKKNWGANGCDCNCKKKQ